MTFSLQKRATPSSPLLTASRPQKSQDSILHTDVFYLKIPKTKINFNNIYYLIYYSILIIIIPSFPILQKGGRKNTGEADDPIYINTIKSIRINKVVINKGPNGWGEGVGNDFGYLLLEGNLSTRIDPQGVAPVTTSHTGISGV